MSKAKPFIKWVGGKGQLIEKINSTLPADFIKWQDITYIEPFVGGGAVLFHILRTYSNIKHAVINDINPDLTQCYKVVKDSPEALISALSEIQKEYYALDSMERKKEFYLLQRDEFNKKNWDAIRNTTLFFFLNRTCFNGLYRVNKSGLFNVPFGRYESPTICDPTTIRADCQLLQNVEILTGDYQQTLEKAQGKTFFYFDPPYRPLNATSNFNDYAKESFNDKAQETLKAFCDKVNESEFQFILSNSDCPDHFFDELYNQYTIERVYAKRNVNSNPDKRGKITEILVRNYQQTKGQATSLF